MALKRLTLVFVFASAALISITALQTTGKNFRMEKKSLRMAYFTDAAKDLDPATITTAEQYNLLRNLYSRLVDQDENSQLVAGVVDSFVTTEDSVTFFFGKKAKTIDGHYITAKDAELSIKRIIMKGNSGHGDIRRFICPEAKLRNLNEPCEGINSAGNKLEIRVVRPYYLQLLLQALESADFSIIPESNIEKSNGSLKDITHKNTSGPYYAEFNFQTNSYILKANPSHYLYHDKMPQEVFLVSGTGQSEIQDFINDKIDLLPTTFIFSGPDAEKVIQSHEYEVHETLPLKNMVIHFSPKAMHDFTPQQRLYAAKKLGQAYSKIVPLSNGKPTVQFFPPTSEGSLDDREIEKIQRLRANEGDSNFSRPIEYAPFRHQIAAYAETLQDSPQFKSIPRKGSPISLTLNERPDIFGVINDSAWAEDLNLLGYNFQVGTFATPGFDSDEWFATYLAVENRAERINRLKALHFKLLESVSMFPVQVAPYYAVIKKPWTLNQHKTAAGTRLWLIRYD